MEVLPEELTFMRVHSGQVTHGDPAGAFLEMSFAALRNLVPRCEDLALYPSYAGVVAWVGRNPALSSLLPSQAFRLVGMFVEATPVSTFREFRTLLETDDERPHLAALGRRGLALMTHGGPRRNLLEQLYFKVHARSPQAAATLSAIKRFAMRRLQRDRG
jgi:hypothetical protein